MYGLEKKLCGQLIKLKERYRLIGIKAEFEAEGASFNDMVRLRRITAGLGIKVFLKIGGVEAVTDIKNSLDIGVDGLIAPMIESKFGVKKFVQAYRKVYKDTEMPLTVNIETRNSIDELDDILDYAKDKVGRITVGRTDLSGSYFNERIYPDSKFMVSLVETIGERIRHYGLSASLGGSISVKSLQLFRQNKKMFKLYDQMETRKVILPSEVLANNPEAIKEAFKFEELYILSKKEINDLFMESEIARLTQLERRL